eukprot:1196426-Prorocentrum_minimum.AAC.9
MSASVEFQVGQVRVLTKSPAYGKKDAEITPGTTNSTCHTGALAHATHANHTSGACRIATCPGESVSDPPS